MTRVLIVEDEPNLGQQLKATLEGAGYAIDLATDGEEGHFLGSTETYDAIVTPPDLRAYTLVGESIDRSGMARATLAPRAGMVAEVPPLRERPADVIELAQYFVKKYSEVNGVALRPFSAEARKALSVHRWPGNVRELRSVVVDIE